MSERVRVIEKEGRDTKEMPLQFEGQLVSETTDADRITWLRLKDCSPGLPERLVRRDLCESVEPVEDETG